jgi:hypothetical protein
MTDWQDQLSDQVRELEAKANGFDHELSAKALAMLRVIRAYEMRVRQLALRSDYRIARNL